jgi:hypothetical protein
MVVFDKSAVVGGARTHAHLHRCPAYVKKQKIKSIPRTRKEKCQTADRWRHLCACSARKALRTCRFDSGFEPFSFDLSGRRRAPRLTSLTGTCQRCQTSERDCLQRCCRDPPRNHPILKLH